MQSIGRRSLSLLCRGSISSSLVPSSPSSYGHVAVRSMSTTASSNRDWKSSYEKLSPVWTHASDVIVERAEGPWIWGTDGVKYLDFTCGIGVTNMGHCHPRIIQAAQKQLTNIVHAQANIVMHKPMLNLVEILPKVVKLSDSDRYFFSNSGAEAIEAAIKLARHATKKTNIITFEGSFHGRTIGTMSLTNSKTVYKVGYQPLMAGVAVSPFAYCLKCPCHKAEPAKYNEHNCCNNPLDHLRDLLKMQSAPEETAAIILEPVLGEGGYVPAPVSFMKGLRQICDEHGILLICDEIQSGFGRTGKWFGYQHYDIVPDIVVMAKGIANGFPLSGLISRAELQNKWKPGSHGGTYGGNAVSCAAAVETITTMLEENVLDNVNERGAQMMKRLQALQAEYPKIIVDVRGKGLMIGMEFAKDVPKGFAGKITTECLKHNMMLLSAGAFETIRFIPPLNATKELIDQGLDIFTKSFKNVVGK